MKLKTLLVSAVALLCSAASWATDYTSKMSSAQGDWAVATGTYGAGAERYNGNTTQFPIGDVLTQTISDLPNGYYLVCFYAWENYSNWEEASISYGNNIAQAFANDATQGFEVIKNKGGRDWNAANTYTLLAEVTDGTLKYGVKNIAAGGNWAVCRPISLTHVEGDLTSVIKNPSFESGDKTGWTDETASDGSGEGRDDKIDILSSGALSGKDGSYFAERWWYNSNMNIYQTTPSLPAGFYRITAYAKAEAGDIVIYGNAGSNDEKTQAVTTLQDYNVEVFQETAGAIKLGLKGHHVTQTHVAFDNFRLTYLGNPYPALEEAIDEAEGKTLGFEVGEYAPYNNVAALTALSSAKAINEAKTATYAEVVAATTALASATWTVNDGKVNAVYNGDFSNSEVGSYATDKAVTGWDKVEGMRQVVTSTVEGSPLYNKHGIYVWGSNTVTYGNTLGYTMPLGANKVYRASYRRMSWSGGTNGHGEIVIKNSNDETVASFGTVTTTGDYNYAGDYNVADASSVTEAIYFVTGEEADTYTAELCPWSNAVFTDVELISVDALPLSESSAVYYAAGTYPSVTLPRELSITNWNTLCLPFETPVSDYAAVRELTDIDVVGDHVSITFTDVDGTLEAGKPYLVKGNGGSSISATDVAVLTTPASAPSVTEDGATVIYNGIFAPMATVPQDAGNYVVSSNNLYLVDSDVSLKGYRGYFNVSVPTSVKSLALNFDDADVIKALEAAENEKSVIYNLAGQRLSKAQKGVNIINGKKVLVK